MGGTGLTATRDPQLHSFQLRPCSRPRAVSQKENSSLHFLNGGFLLPNPRGLPCDYLHHRPKLQTLTLQVLLDLLKPWPTAEQHPAAWTRKEPSIFLALLEISSCLGHLVDELSNSPTGTLCLQMLRDPWHHASSFWILGSARYSNFSFTLEGYPQHVPLHWTLDISPRWEGPEF